MVAQFGALLLEDVMLRLTMGVAKRPTANEIRRRATDATDAFLRLYPEREAKRNPNTLTAAKAA